jgi:hypothetical protein
VALLRRLRGFLVQRTIVLVLPGLLAVAFAAGRAANALVSLALASLILALWDMGRSAWVRTTCPSPESWRSVSRASADALERAARRRGYVRLGRGPGLRLVRHPWSLWARFLLHSGMLVAAAAFLAGRGMPTFLAAFALTILGAFLLALAPPRELVLEPGDGGTVRVGWTAYRDRGDAELDALFGARRAHVELR